MPAREDCRHHQLRTTQGGERLERCRLDAATVEPGRFDCPADCLFFESRGIADAGWHVPDQRRP